MRSHRARALRPRAHRPCPICKRQHLRGWALTCLRKAKARHDRLCAGSPSATLHTDPRCPLWKIHYQLRLKNAQLIVVASSATAELATAA